jgi:hypothetical protein
VRLTAEQIDAALAKIARRDAKDLPPIPPPTTGQPLALFGTGPLAPDAFGTLPPMPAEEVEAVRRKEEAAARRAWNARLSLARSSIPERFAWVQPPTGEEVKAGWEPGPDFRTYLPWIGAEHARALLRIWSSGRNVLLFGPVSAGKTSLLAWLMRWSLAAGAYDGPLVRRQREQIDAYTRHIARDGTKRYAPLDPDHVPHVREAIGARFVSSEGLLTEDGRGVHEGAVIEAKAATLLFLDEIGKEIGKDYPGAYLAGLRAPAVQGVIQTRWNRKRRWFATTMFSPETLSKYYDLGTWRRLVDEESGALFVDLDTPHWAGPWLAKRATEVAQGGRTRR